MSDVESIADRIAIMRGGTLIQSVTANVLQQKVAEKCWTLTIEPSDLKQIQHEYIVSHSIRKEGKLELNLVADHCPDSKATVRAASLEDAYLYFTSEQPAPRSAARIGL